MTDTTDYKPLYRALACALASLRGEADGYTEEEKSLSIVVLDALLADTLKKING